MCAPAVVIVARLVKIKHCFNTVRVTFLNFFMVNVHSEIIIGVDLHFSFHIF
jgi:hypothetical protein